MMPLLKNKQSVQEGLNYDWEVHIATASSRKAETWRNGTTTVATFAAKLGNTIRTPETVEQYARMPKPEQDQIKDVGGFVGGMLKSGRRKSTNVANRHLLTLDMDHAPVDALDKIREALPAACWTVYSTHKHTEARPRLRLVVYPDRSMLPDEYQPAMRRVADKVGIEYFDHTTYQINRMMYWPSTSSDGDFVFEHNDQPPLAVDALLAEYGEGDAWQDISRWPIGSSESNQVRRKVDRQADPLTKKGLVGAVCRTISIRQAIADYLGDKVYRRESDDRYSYAYGTTSSGLVVYDNKFAYSNHESDPAFGQTCNAFDLLRIHKFGMLDEEVAAGTPTHKLPSYRAMIEWAGDQKVIKRELVGSGIEIDADAFDVFSDLEDSVGVEVAEDEAWPPEWFEDLQTADNGIVKTTFVNALTIMEKDTRLRSASRFNEFSMLVENAVSGDNWTAADSYRVRKYIGRRYKCDFPERKVEQAIENRAYGNKYHPIRNYLQSLEWDGEERIERLLIDFFGADDCLYVREVTRCWFTAAVYRVMEPGYKFDHMLVLGGAQGIGKSSFVEIMAKDVWFGELSSFDNKIAMEEISGRWLVEIGELGATNRHELEQQKAFLSARSTRVRPAYGTHAVDYLRQCVFIGTTNQEEYLKDSTGNRRSWPIDCRDREIDLDGLRSVVDQVWAEAFALYALDYSTLLSPEARKQAMRQQEDKRESDSWEGIILEWLDQNASVSRYEVLRQFDNMEFPEEVEKREKVCAVEIWEDCLKMRQDIKQIDRRRIAGIIKKADAWEKIDHQTRFGGRFGKQKGWRRVVPF